MWIIDKYLTMLSGTDKWNREDCLCKRCFSFFYGLSWAETTWKIELMTPPLFLVMH